MSGSMNQTMKIVADENIPFVREIFGSLGRVICCSGRNMHCGTVADADALLVRSVTKVDRKLLENSPVRFVGTATIGTDHVDQEYLKGCRIAFADAAGSNANSVAEYVVAAVLVLAQKYNWNLEEKILGIIGVGNIGSRLEKKAQALSMRVLPNDPPLQRQTNDSRYVSLDQLLEMADVITCHVPLTNTGRDATYHLFDEKTLARMKGRAALINTSRGPVVDNGALGNALAAGAIGPVVLDVWENEPNIDAQLLNRVAIGTPHIAGYSLDGKVNGTAMLYDAICRFLNTPNRLLVDQLMPAPQVPVIELNTTDGSDQQLLSQGLGRIYKIMHDDLNFREINNKPPDERGQCFDFLRRNYPVRREVFNTRAILKPHKASLAEKLAILGFQIES